jgi:hypothetical protein
LKERKKKIDNHKTPLYSALVVSARLSNVAIYLTLEFLDGGLGQDDQIDQTVSALWIS